MSNGIPTRPRVGIAVFIQHPKSQLHKSPVFLLGLRKGSHGSGTWGLPGGHLEFGESFQDCATREVMEETGLQLQDVQFLTATNDVFALENKHYATIFMVGQVALDEAARRDAQHAELKAELREPEKCMAWEWFSWEDITALVAGREVDGSSGSAAHHPPFLPLVNLVKQRPDVRPFLSVDSG